MQQRLCGREQEFGLWLKPDKLIDNDEVFVSRTVQAIIKEVLKIIPGALFQMRDYFPNPYNDYLPGHLGYSEPGQQSVYAASRYWFQNGWKIYEDLRLLEVASAESFAGSLDAVAQEKAMEQVLSKAISRLRHFPSFKNMALYKNNVAPRAPYNNRVSNVDLSEEISYGSHHNYSYLIRKQKPVFYLLRSFIPASLLLTGNGHILRPGIGKKKCVFGFSERARYVNRVISIDSSTGGLGRGLINKRNQHYNGKVGDLSRLHLVSRDATRCEFQTWLVDAVTHLVLRLAEEGWKLPAELGLRRPLVVLWELNQNADFSYKVSTYSGKMNIVDYNRIFLRAAQQISPLSLMEKKALEEWARVLELLKAGAWKKLVGELDWATKKFLLETKMKERGFSLDSVPAWTLSREYHNISSAKESWFARMDEAGLIRHMVTEAQIKQAIVNPPKTRAAVRGEMVRLCFKNKNFARKVKFLDWDMAKIVERGKERFLYFDDPNDQLF